MHTCMKNDPAFLPNLIPIWNDAAFGLFWRGCPNKNKMSSDMGSVPDRMRDRTNNIIADIKYNTHKPFSIIRIKYNLFSQSFIKGKF